MYYDMNSEENISKIMSVKKELKNAYQLFLLQIATSGKHYTIDSKECFIAGGSIASLILGEEIKDYDMFFKDSVTAIDAKKFFLEKEVCDKFGVVDMMYEIQNAITLNNKWQIVYTIAGQPKELMKTFDYLHTKTWYDIGEDKLYISPATFNAIMNKKLIIKNGKEVPEWRRNKFISRGWTE